MAKAKLPHSGHDKHLCYLTNLDFHNSNIDEYKGFVINPEYMCQNCGRVAADKKNLCKPVKI